MLLQDSEVKSESLKNLVSQSCLQLSIYSPMYTLPTPFGESEKKEKIPKDTTNFFKTSAFARKIKMPKIYFSLCRRSQLCY